MSNLMCLSVFNCLCLNIWWYKSATCIPNSTQHKLSFFAVMFPRDRLMRWWKICSLTTVPGSFCLFQQTCLRHKNSSCAQEVCTRRNFPTEDNLHMLFLSSEHECFHEGTLVASLFCGKISFIYRKVSHIVTWTWNIAHFKCFYF